MLNGGCGAAALGQREPPETKGCFHRQRGDAGAVHPNGRQQGGTLPLISVLLAEGLITLKSPAFVTNTGREKCLITNDRTIYTDILLRLIRKFGDRIRKY